MDVATITMPKEEAKKKLRACRAQLHRRANGEYEALQEGYAALASGTPLIDVEDVIRNAPVDEKARPRFAIARADRRQVRVWWPHGETICHYLTTTDFRFDGRWPELARTVDMGREHNYQKVSEWRPGDGPQPTAVVGYALVPMVPPDVRPSGQLRGWYVLWEVEQWSDKSLGAQPDRDPYLLKHLGGSLYSVIATWDLTDLERAIMRGRAE